MYTRVESRFWQDEKMRTVSDDARYLMLYLLTSPHRNVLGFYFLPEPYACFDLGWTAERFRERLGELLRNGLVNYDETVHVVLIANFIKHNPLENHNQVKSAVQKLDEIPKTPLLKNFYEAVKKYSYDKSHYSSLLERLEKRLGEPLPEPLPEPLGERFGKQEKEKEKEKEEEKEKEKEEEKEPLSVTCKRIVDYLNEKAGTQYKYTTRKTSELIQARLREGFVEDDFFTVIDKKCAEWKNTEWEKFLRPETLFSNKFEGYLNQKTIIKQGGPQSNNPFLELAKEEGLL